MKKISGVVTALVSPFAAGRLDLDSFRTLLKAQVDGGVTGFVIGGTTGESPTVTREELEHMYLEARKVVPESCGIILGTGSNSTDDTVEKTRWAEMLGADAALVVTPYYNKPPQAGLKAHYTEVAGKTGIPLIIYNVPGRTGVSIQSETVGALSRVETIVGVKDATGDLQILESMKGLVRDGFLLLSGDDATCVDYCARGGHGVISVVSHLIPAKLSAFIARARRGDPSAADEFKTFHRLIDLIFVEANPIPVKAALREMGLIATDDLRLPLVSMSQENRSRLVAEMRSLDLTLKPFRKGS